MGRLTSNIDWLTTILLLCIGCFGLFILLTIQVSFFASHLFFLFLGAVLMVACSRFDGVVVRWFAPIGYILSCILIILTHFSPIVRGASRWISIGGTQILQPSELSKPLFLLAFAWLIEKFPPRQIRFLPLHVLFFLVPFLLVYTQPDLGTSIVYVLMWFAMMIAGGLSLFFVALFGLGAFFLIPIVFSLLKDYQRTRIFTFLDPALDPKGAGYNAIQAMIAVGSGQFFGRGLGRGTQSHLRFLPEFHTDFIFATLVEEFGFFGGFLLLVSYAVLFVRIIIVTFSDASHSLFVFAYSFGLFSMLLVQVFINVGMNMGLVPITGITLPLVSYGGSSVLSICMGFGFLWALLKDKTSRHEVPGIASG
ncbi:rod shape-determining protein RodA, partial [Candidatus Gottesmanbacteria bacterium]|nr:rod shape-determining protein RodA [Candidatus Gottesmanbacteria bacterium]